MKQSPFLSIGAKDVLKGFLVAVLTVVVTGLGTSLNAGHFPDVATLQSLGLTGLGAGVAYLLKNVFTNSQDQFATPEPPTK